MLLFHRLRYREGLQNQVKNKQKLNETPKPHYITTKCTWYNLAPNLQHEICTVSKERKRQAAACGLPFNEFTALMHATVYNRDHMKMHALKTT